MSKIMTVTRVEIYHNKLAAKRASALGQAYRSLEQRIIKDTDPYVPAKTRELSNSARNHKFAQLGSGYIVYNAFKSGKRQGYARYLYEGLLMVSPTTLSPWAKKGEKKVLDPNGRRLKYSKSVHPSATSKWFDKAKKSKVREWEEVAKTAYKAGWQRYGQ